MTIPCSMQQHCMTLVPVSSIFSCETHGCVTKITTIIYAMWSSHTAFRSHIFRCLMKLSEPSPPPKKKKAVKVKVLGDFRGGGVLVEMFVYFPLEVFPTFSLQRFFASGGFPSLSPPRAHRNPGFRPPKGWKNLKKLA